MATNFYLNKAIKGYGVVRSDNGMPKGVYAIFNNGPEKVSVHYFNDAGEEKDFTLHSQACGYVFTNGINLYYHTDGADDGEASGTIELVSQIAHVV